MPETTTAEALHYRTCNLCEAMCGLEIEVAEGRVAAVRGDRDDPFSRGYLCPKAVALQDIHADPDRLRRPVRRRGSGWEEIGWEEALDEVAAGLAGVRERWGADAVAVYLGNPNVHNLGSMLLGGPLRRALGTRNSFSATSVDQLPHHVAARYMFGHFFLLPIPDVDRTDYFLALGANPLASNGSLMTAPGIGRRLRAVQERGGKVLVVDPRRTETARAADEHLFIRPGHDVLLLAAMVHTLFADGLVALGRLESLLDGVAEVEAAVSDLSPETVAAACGVDANTIRRLTHEFAAADSAVCYGRMGLSTQSFGGSCQWLVNLLNILTGNLDRPGGVMFPTPAFDIVTERRAGAYGRWKSRVRELPEFFGELPVSVMAEEMDTPGEGQIRGFLSIAGNPVLSTPDGGRLDSALESLDFMASIDIYINETSRHAQVILPPATGLECDHYDVVFHTLAVRNTAKYSPALFEPEAGALYDWQIYRELARRLAGDEWNPAHPLNFATPRQILDQGLRDGPYGGDGLSLEALEEAPHGVDLGPLTPRLPERLFTENRRIRMAPEEFVVDLSRARDLTEGTADAGQLELIGRRHLRSNNSWMHNSDRLVRGRDRCTLMIHPRDAEARKIRSGELVTVSSRVGRIEIAAEVTEDVMPGVVSVPHGWGHGREGVVLGVAKAHAGSSVNDLTDGERTDWTTGNAALNGVPVEVSASC